MGVCPLRTPFDQRTGSHIYKEAWETLPDEVKAAVNAQDFASIALGGPRSFTVAEALVWNAVYGQTVAVLAAQAAKPSKQASKAATAAHEAAAKAACTLSEEDD